MPPGECHISLVLSPRTADDAIHIFKIQHVSECHSKEFVAAIAISADYCIVHGQKHQCFFIEYPARMGVPFEQHPKVIFSVRIHVRAEKATCSRECSIDLNS